MSDSQKSWSDWTKSTKASDLEKIRQELEQIKKWQRTHAGTDFAAAGIDFPHPSQRVRVLTFFEGNGRLDQTGIQFVQNGLNPPPAITVVSDQFYDDPELVVPRFIIQPNVYSGTLPNSYSVGMVTADGAFGISGSGAPDQSAYLTAGTGNEFLFATLFLVGDGNVTGWWVEGGALRLYVVSSDPGGMTDGQLWYRSDLDRFRARANGVTENLAYESDIPAVPTQFNIWPYVAKTTTYTTVATDGFIRADATSASFTITLLTAVGNAGLIQVFKKIDGTNNTVTIDASSTQTIDGALTYVLSAEDEFCTIISDGANWHVISRSTPPRFTAVTGTYTTLQRDSVISCDATSASFTVTLVTAVGNAGLTQTFKKINAANVVTLDPNSSQTIDGLATYALSAQWSWVTFVSDGANWLITGAG